MPDTRPELCGVILAAGLGTRFGSPKAYARHGGTSWITLVAGALRAGGCSRVVVALGRAHEDAGREASSLAEPILIDRPERGLATTLHQVLASVETSGTRRIDGYIVIPVDNPDVSPFAVERVIAAAGRTIRTALVQAVYEGRPGHPVLIGSEHVQPLQTMLSGDSGARKYLVCYGVREIECGDLWDGRDHDFPTPGS